jgi:hypothetical protein
LACEFHSVVDAEVVMIFCRILGGHLGDLLVK